MKIYLVWSWDGNYIDKNGYNEIIGVFFSKKSADNMAQQITEKWHKDIDSLEDACGYVQEFNTNDDPIK